MTSKYMGSQFCFKDLLPNICYSRFSRVSHTQMIFTLTGCKYAVGLGFTDTQPVLHAVAAPWYP